jgi:hypothetical protein
MSENIWERHEPYPKEKRTTESNEGGNEPDKDGMNG